MINDMQYLDIAKQIFSAIDIIVDKKLKSLDFDRCIVAQVYSIEDGVIKCKFQDMVFEAHPMNVDILLTAGDFVYILIPQNDFANDKFIIGLRKSS